MMNFFFRFPRVPKSIEYQLPAMPKSRQREYTRVQIISLKKEGLSLGKIVESTGVDRRTVQRVWKRYLLSNTIQDKPRSGCPEKLSPRDKRKVLYHLKSGESNTATAITKQLQKDDNTVMSKSDPMFWKFDKDGPFCSTYCTLDHENFTGDNLKGIL